MLKKSLFVFLFISISVKAQDLADVECGPGKKCKDPNAVCDEGYCTCKKGYDYNGEGNCFKIPLLNDKCIVKDEILTCGGPGVDPICPDNGPNKGKCQCETGYTPKGKSCVFQDKNLGDACKVDSDCGVSFSVCQSGKCTCAAGFTADGAICKSTPKCPNGEPLMENGAPKACELGFNEKSNQNDKDSCPKTHRCFTHPLLRSQSGGEAGYCCPKPVGKKTPQTPVCPLGDALATAVCSNYVEISDNPSDNNLDVASSDVTPAPNECPALTHTCIETGINKTVLCCPAPCRNYAFFSFEGRCYQNVAVGEPCKVDMQCDVGAQCVGDASGKNKKCQCKAGLTFVDDVCQ